MTTSQTSIEVHHTDTSSGDWSEQAAEARMRDEAGSPVLRRAYAWVDKTMDPDSKTAYRALHHEVDSEGAVGPASIVACRDLIALLNGARSSGAAIPAADRRDVYNHLASHLRDAGLVPPELRANPLTAYELEAMTVSERRFTPGRVEVRATSGEHRSIGGYAAVFNKLSSNLGGFVEQVEPGFFSRSRTEGWPGVICRYNHSDDMLLGTTNSGTLRLHVDDIGLVYEVDPPQARADILELVTRGDIQRSSFAFRVTEESWSLTEQGYPKRSLHSGQLIDVAPVLSPAYLDTTVGLRSLAAYVGAPEEEVRKAAESNDLRRFLARRDSGKTYTPPAKAVFGPAARMSMLGRARDPWADRDR